MKTRTKPYEPQWFASPISIKEGKSGKVAVSHRTLTEKTPIIGLRQALMRGIRPVMLRLQEPLVIHELSEDKAVWMTDLPEELNQIGQMIHEVRPWGRVCIGGLGLGIAAKMVSASQMVREVVVVEKNPDVIKLCAAPGYAVVEDDIAHYLKTNEVPFDFYLLDTWAGTGECVWWDTVFPLRRTIRNRFGTGPTIHCWAEDIMLGQVEQAILHGVHNGKRHWKYEGLPLKMSPREARRFVTDIGSASWEKTYGHLYNGEKK